MLLCTWSMPGHSGLPPEQATVLLIKAVTWEQPYFRAQTQRLQRMAPGSAQLHNRRTEAWTLRLCFCRTGLSKKVDFIWRHVAMSEH